MRCYLSSRSLCGFPFWWNLLQLRRQVPLLRQHTSQPLPLRLWMPWVPNPQPRLSLHKRLHVRQRPSATQQHPEAASALLLRRRREEKAVCVLKAVTCELPKQRPAAPPQHGLEDGPCHRFRPYRRLRAAVNATGRAVTTPPRPLRAWWATVATARVR